MWLLLLGGLIVLLWLYMYKTFNYFKSRGIDTPKYHYFVGNSLEQFTFKKNTGVIMQDAYNKFKGYNYFGFYNAIQPTVIIKSPELVGTVLVKDFSYFADNNFDIDENVDPIFGKNPFILKGDRWKQVRAQITPSFTAGKIKTMLPLINETSTKLLDYLKDKQNTPLDAHRICKQITAENVASCAFGLNGGSFTTDNAKFLEISNQLVNPTTWNIIKSMILFFIPSLSRFVKIRFFFKDTVEFLTTIVQQTMQYRKDNNMERKDFLDEMFKLKAKINDEKQFNFSDILAHAGGFFLDGIETSATVICHGLYEVAASQEIQEKLRDEIRRVLAKYNNEVTYEALQEMEYFDWFFKENLRRHPAIFFLSKRSTKPYTLPPMREDNTGPRFKVDVGTSVLIPMFALHHDPEYFPEPEKFIPERFSPENKDKIVKFTYLPFGDGPRACLGLRFGILQSKIAILTLVNNFKITVNSKTKKPIQIDPTNFLNMPVGGYWLEFSKL